MANIVNYDVFVDFGKGWDFEERFSEENRESALYLAQKFKDENKPVKIVCETFDIEKNIYTERLEYISKNPKNIIKSAPMEKVKVSKKISTKEDVVITKSSKSTIAMLIAFAKLVFIIILGLIITNILVTVIFPVVEFFVGYEYVKKSMFLIFFTLFLLITIPLLVKKVPWDAFSLEDEYIINKVDTKRFIDKALYVNSLFAINDKSNPPVPVAVDVDIEYKNDIILFLNSIISSLHGFRLKNDFTKLGLKFVIFGGCMELSKYSGLSLSVANALLIEAFSVIDGENNVKLEEFYEAKSSYKDSELAIFMTGLGADWMNNNLNGKPNRKDILNKTFQKWRSLNQKEPIAKHIERENKSSKEISVKSYVGIKIFIKHDENIRPMMEKDSENISETYAVVRNIIKTLISKYTGANQISDKKTISISFDRLDIAVKFVIDLFNSVDTYKDRMDLSDMVFYTSFVIVEYATDVTMEDYLDDVLDHVYSDEIVVSEKIEQELKKAYKFDYLGNKYLKNTMLEKDLYRLTF